MITDINGHPLKQRPGSDQPFDYIKADDCTKTKFTSPETATQIIQMLRQMGWLRGTWMPYLCWCGGVHLRRIKDLKTV